MLLIMLQEQLQQHRGEASNHSETVAQVVRECEWRIQIAHREKESAQTETMLLREERDREVLLKVDLDKKLKLEKEKIRKARAEALSNKKLLERSQRQLKKESKDARDKDEQIKRLTHQLKNYGNCCICLERPVSMLLLPCKHACTCEDCTDALEVPSKDGQSSSKSCPICQISVEKAQNFWLHGAPVEVNVE